MELSHRFTVPIGVEETWAHFNDIASVAECFPGAQVTEADEESFSGSVKVKLGPIALALVKRNIDAALELLVDGMSAAQTVIVAP